MLENRSRMNFADGKMSRTRLLEITVNGETHEITAKPRVMLLEVIRDKIGLTGTKDGCESGTCGACTVLLDGKPTLSCITLAVECEGKTIRTVEDLADGDNLNGLQEAFLDQGGTQCGFCTPGMLMSATSLLEKNPKPTRQDINKALEGNLCRCTGYNAIVDAVMQASGQGVKAKMQ
jgi:carbon-monoxide dehydrogenase small subunit